MIVLLGLRNEISSSVRRSNNFTLDEVLILSWWKIVGRLEKIYSNSGYCVKNIYNQSKVKFLLNKNLDYCVIYTLYSTFVFPCKKSSYRNNLSFSLYNCNCTNLSWSSTKFSDSVKKSDISVVKSIVEEKEKWNETVEYFSLKKCENFASCLS